MRVRHVGINAVFLQPRMGGLDTLTQQLIPALVRRSPSTRFSVFLSPAGRRYVQDAEWAQAVELVTHPLLGRRPFKAISEMTLLGTLAQRRGVEVLHSVAMTAPLRMRPAGVVTIADVLWMEERTGSPATERLWRAVVPHTARAADRVIAISEAGRADIVRLLGVPADRIDVVMPGVVPVDPDRPEMGADVRGALDLGQGPLVLSASAKKPYKNLRRLVEAWPAVLAAVPSARLVLPGAPTPYEEELKGLAGRLGVDHTIRFLGFVESHDLAALYEAATCFAFPSLREGFGLPVLEAMQRGLPVACSSAAALPEAGGDAVLYFDPGSTEQIADRITTLLSDEDLRDRLAGAGRRRAREFNWERAAEQTIEVYERAAFSACTRR